MVDRFARAVGRTFQGFDEEHEACPNAPFTFVQLADTQLGMMPAMKKVQWMRRFRAIGSLSFGLIDSKALVPIPLDLQPDLSEEAAYEAEKALSVAAVERINALSPRPKFAVVCGDLVHAFPHQTEEQERQVRSWRILSSHAQGALTL